MSVFARALEPVLAFILTATLFGSCIAHAQVVQPQYVRPSKGAAITVFDKANPPNGFTETSVVYDMSAFAEAQFDATLVQGGTTTVDSYNVAFLGRYIKVQAVYTTPNLAVNPPRLGSVVYSVLGSDSATGNFTLLRGPGAWQLESSGGSSAITNAKLVLTPLPYTTNQYTRPGKGNTISLYNGTLSTLNPMLPPVCSPAIDMRGFASLEISIRYSSPAGCRYFPGVIVAGGSTASTACVNKISSPNAVRTTSESYSYVVPVPSSFAGVYLYQFDTGAGNDCNVFVDVTPLPYVPADGTYPVNSAYQLVSLINPGGASNVVQLAGYLRNLRIQNLGNGKVDCGATSGTWPISLAPQTARTGDGGVWEINGFSGDYLNRIYCSSVAGTTIGVFQY